MRLKLLSLQPSSKSTTTAWMAPTPLALSKYFQDPGEVSLQGVSPSLYLHPWPKGQHLPVSNHWHTLKTHSKIINIAPWFLCVLVFFIMLMKTLKPCRNVVVSKPHGAATAFVLLPLVRFLPVMVSDSLQISGFKS